MEPPTLRYRWVMLGLVWLLYFVFGVYTRCLAPLVTPILKDLNIQFIQMGFILGSWQFTYIAFAAVDGAIIDRWGLKKSILAGTIVMGLSVMLRCFAGGFIPLLFCVCLIGIGGPMISIGCPKAISLWFNDSERGLATGIYMTAPSLGGLAALSTANSIVMPLTENSWRLTFVVYGALAFIGAIAWSLAAKDIQKPETTGKTGVLAVFSDLVRLRTVQLILLMGLLSFTIMHGFDNWIPQILESRGVTPTAAGFTASIPLVVSIPALLLIPRIIPPRARGYAIAAMFMVVALSLVLVATGSGMSLTVGLALYGLSSMPTMPLLMLILMESPEVGSKYIGSAAGLFFCVAEIGGFSGPFLLGVVRNTTGDFLASTLLIATLSVITAFVGLFLKRKTSGQT